MCKIHSGTSPCILQPWLREDWTMNSFPTIQTLLIALSLAVGGASYAQNAPGEDPVVLNSRVSYQFLPLNNQKKSGDLDANPQLPAWMQAKISRYTAKAFSPESSGIYTDKDVSRTVQSNGMSTTCVQDVGSATSAGMTSGRYGPKPQDQVVVLRGDLVNICY